MARVESLLSARLFLAPQAVGDRIYFISNLSGRMSLYAMDHGGSIPEPLIPPHLALQNPALVSGSPFVVFPSLGRILVMVDRDGDERYQPMAIPLDGGLPEPAFTKDLSKFRCHAVNPDIERNIVYLTVESVEEQSSTAYQGDFASGSLQELTASSWAPFAAGANRDHTRVAIVEGYTPGDHILREWRDGNVALLYGVPIEERAEGQQVPLNSIWRAIYTPDDQGLLVFTSLFDDAYGLGYLPLDGSGEIEPVAIDGLRHTGAGELDDLDELPDGRYLIGYNIDGVSWLYEGTFDEPARRFTVDRVVAGEGDLAEGVVEQYHHDPSTGTYSLTFSSATSPAQIYTVDDGKTIRHTSERILGIPAEHLSQGEDASFESWDGLRVSARLYRPATDLGFEGPRPLVYYIHGGPQSQERPDFTWFSMPLIQYLTLRGFAVFVPNARGSSGYGLDYMKKVDRDWGGDDRLDHVHALTEVLAGDSRIDTSRTGVMGRSYGGYMTLTLTGRHPELWSAAVDMFGPYDLVVWFDRLPETWKPYFHLIMGHPERDRDFLVERSPATNIENISCPLMVIQGKNDPRVVESESSDLVERLRGVGKEVEYLVFEDEGHDVLKFPNLVRCYTAIGDFFETHLGRELEEAR